MGRKSTVLGILLTKKAEYRYDNSWVTSSAEADYIFENNWVKIRMLTYTNRSGDCPRKSSKRFQNWYSFDQNGGMLAGKWKEATTSKPVSHGKRVDLCRLQGLVLSKADVPMPIRSGWSILPQVR